VRLQLEVAINRALKTPSPGEGGKSGEHKPLHGVGGLFETELRPVAGREQHTEQRRRAPFGVGVTSAQSPHMTRIASWNRIAGSMRTRACTSPLLAFHHRCQVPGAIVTCSPAITARIAPSIKKATRPA
jgi:hypothetical protein